MTNTADGDDGYREKYRRTVEELDHLEKTYSAQVELLRKTLIRVSTVALGLDDELDSALNGMLEKFRAGTGVEIVKQIEQVNLTVDEFEQARPAKTAIAAKDLSLLVENLLALKIPRGLSIKLKSLKKGLEKRLENYSAYPAVIEELGRLQLLSIGAAAGPETNFWRKLRSGKTLIKAEDASTNDCSEEASEAGMDLENIAASVSESDFVIDGGAEGEWIHHGRESSAMSTALQTTAHFNAGTENDFREVATRIAVTIDGLVEKIEPNDLIKHKIDIVKMRLKRGMDWYSLAVTLEDLRDILLLRYLQTDQDFSEYLKRVNSQLQVIGDSLGLAVQREESLNSSASVLTDSVSEQIGLIEGTLKSSDDVNTLKAQVSENLSAIQGALAEFKRAQANNKPLSEQLVALVNQVQAIEEESLKNKELLEEERYKATHDALTNLPNREAYNERVYHEHQRFSRYGHPLVLAVADIDRFKTINDTYGHQAGDRVLKLVGKLIGSNVRKVDFVGRYGGEEFVILLPETSAEDAKSVLNKVRESMANTPFRFKDEPIQITISIGLSQFNEQDTIESVFERADSALYRAKANGRNRCEVDHS